MKLAIVVSHPIQYYTPWYRILASEAGLELRVFFLWDFGVSHKEDPDFGRKLSWDIPLLEGYDYEFVPNTSKRPGTNHFFGLNNPALIRRLQKWEPDAILIYGYNAKSLLNVIFSASLSRIPKILRGDSHRLVTETGWKTDIKKVLIKKIFSRFRAALYVGKANKEYLQMHGFREKNLFFSPHAVDTERFFPDVLAARVKRKKLGFNEHDRVLLFAGKFEPKKCPVELVQTFVRRAPLGWKLLMVGAGALESSAREAAGGDPRVVFGGFANQTEMPDIYRAVDMVILPSLGPGETWGLFVHEALCCGKPAIVSSHVGCALDLVSEGKNGHIYPAGDWAVLGNILSRLPEKSDKIENMGRESLRIVSNYSYENATYGLKAALDYVLHV